MLGSWQLVSPKKYWTIYLFTENVFPELTSIVQCGSQKKNQKVDLCLQNYNEPANQITSWNCFLSLIEENSISRIKVPHYCPIPSSSRWHSYKICIHTGNLGRKWVPVSLPQMTCWEIENHGETVLVCFSYCS